MPVSIARRLLGDLSVAISLAPSAGLLLRRGVGRVEGTTGACHECHCVAACSANHPTRLHGGDIKSDRSALRSLLRQRTTTTNQP